MKRYKCRKAILFSIMMICAAVLCFKTDTKAETGTGTIKGSNVNVRQGAGTTYEKVTSLGNGAAVVVLGSAADTAGQTWYQVKFTQNGKEYIGYIIKNYVNYSGAVEETPATESSTESAETDYKKGTVKGTNVNVRKKTVSGAVIGSVSNGTEVTILRSKKSTDGKKWHYISVIINGSAKKGWIRSDFVSVEQKKEPETVDTGIEEESGYKSWSALITAQNVNVRKSPVSGTVKGTVSAGKKITVRGEQTGTDGKTWYYITYNSKKKDGWVRFDFVKKRKTSDKEETENSEEKPSEQENATHRQGVMKGNYVRVRKSPVNGAMICYLMSGTSLTIIAEEKGTDGLMWYQVLFAYGGAEKKGYVRSDFVEVKEEPKVQEEDETETEEIDITVEEEFENYLNEQGFPESYKNALRKLHDKHPNWEFRAVQTGLAWSDVIAAESKVGTSLVTKTAISSWKSTEKTAYNWKTNSWYTFDGGAWVAASKELVSYYMDPRNFLTEQTIFQFESLEYEPYQNKTGVQRLLSGSFMSGKYTEPNGKKRTYAATFVTAGKKVGVNPYHLAARCYQEQGTGKSGSISGTVPGYENIFNYYNIGAYASGGNSPVVQGLIYASSKGGSTTNYNRPWDTRYKSIMGGAEYVAQKYVKVGQNTLYFQKFNVVNKKNGLYRHQYMTNIQAAEAEAVKMSKAYTAEDAELAFYIPVYQNMPDFPCAKPVGNENPNNYLATLEVKKQQLTPVFSPEITEYDLTIPKKVKKVTIQATPVAGTSTVTGTGKTAKLSIGENIVKIVCRAENGTEKTYTIHIVREDS